jgi:hypothetical protein
MTAGDIGALRAAIFNIWNDQVMMAEGIGAGERASLMRA